MDAAERRLQRRAQDASYSINVRDNAKQSIAALRELRLINELARYDFADAPRRRRSFDVEGVAVSGYVDMLVLGAYRGTPQIGAAMLRFNKDGTGDEAQPKRRETGEYAATILYMFMQSRNWLDRTPAPRLCLSIDVRAQTVYKAPRSDTRRIQNIKAACKTIAMQWNQIP